MAREVFPDPNTRIPRVSTDEMAPDFLRGDLLLFSPEKSWQDGDVCLIRQGDTHSIRRVRGADTGFLGLECLGDRTKHTMVKAKDVQIEGVKTGYVRFDQPAENTGGQQP